MLKGWEHQTSPLDDYEKDVLLPLFVNGLKTKIGHEKAVTNPQMIRALKQAGYKKLSEPRVRKIINHIRSNGLIVNLVASSKGYWIENDIEKRREYVETVKQRASSMLAGLKYIEI